MLKKILVANRGEIACRVIRSARRMGIATVAVYSDADAGAPHTLMADEAIRIGPAPAAESYLVVDAILAAIKESGADAVHPGYGFLSENAAFVRALGKAGITFIGPKADAIAAMGDKIESKKLADRAGVSTVPGYLGEVPDADSAVKIARDVGYPVMIKASAGGGGKGMRIARDDDSVLEGFERAVSEAKSSFGDDRVFIERYVETPRHIEIQVLADTHGTVLYLGERECSIQRRHQKVIEEAPSPFLDDSTRRAMGEQAVALSKSVGYVSAGTVEFIVDPERNFFFLEMNTRLQVEHPVTECVTGLDLVEQMILIAAGEKLQFAQDDVQLNGWAMESRIYAEDPERGFLPSIGRLTGYSVPTNENGVRVDTGVEEGSDISRFYDPMIAKLITSGADRAEATARMATALDQFYVRGIAHNVRFLRDVVDRPVFKEGALSTGFIDQTWPDGYVAPEPTDDQIGIAAAIGALAHLRRTIRRPDGPVGNWVAVTGSIQVPMTVAATEFGCSLDIAGASVDVATDWNPGDAIFRGSIAGRDVTAQIDSQAEGVVITLGPAVIPVALRVEKVAELMGLMPVKVPPDMSKFLLSPMPGMVVSINVTLGQVVETGTALAVVDAMKMENVLTAERDGTIKELHAGPGDSLAVDQIILEFE
ncbi:MAG: acetyl/propionyl/methylcrotonyl-CoA carboxylase subunit alpha [Alphaproteobacteria bacterium]|nr:acetyl/propionyl/methylcrotonyl-CoA carboxylase subunit alpha [Alphaproteobacteria bacterium]